VRSEWPVITRELAYNQSMIDGRGLLVTNDTDGMDWDFYDGNKTGEVTAYNDIYYETLIDAATLAAALGLDAQATAYRQQASDLRTAINRYLFDPSSGLYVLSNLRPTAVAQDANSLAVLLGIAPPAHDAAILTALTKTLPSTPYGPLPFTGNSGYRTAVSPFVTNEEVEAFFATGATASAMALMQTLWGHMDAPGPDDTDADWELVGSRGHPGFGAFTSLAHGWASGATAALSSEVLGVRPVAAGFRQWSVAPHPGTLSWAEGDVPTPHGTISVRWAQDRSSDRLSLQVGAPAGTQGTISVPLPRAGALVSVRTSGAGRRSSTRRITTIAGASHLTIAVAGGTSSNIDLTPR
jgi:alpha-L-rhamnosidase